MVVGPLMRRREQPVVLWLDRLVALAGRLSQGPLYRCTHAMCRLGSPHFHGLGNFRF